MTFRATTTAVLFLSLSLPLSAQSLIHEDDFEGPDGSAWPAPWFEIGGSVPTHDLQGGRARWNSNTGQVARMILPGYSEVDVDLRCVIEFESFDDQGFGFYVRQNGGYLRQSDPHGQGYALFFEGGGSGPQAIGLWREFDGVETRFANRTNPIEGGVQDGVRYSVRFRVVQQDAFNTLLRCKVWPEAEAEPAAWSITATDGTPALQGTAGSFAADVYNYRGTGHLFLDDLAIHESCPAPLILEADPPQVAAGQSLSLRTGGGEPLSGRLLLAVTELNGAPFFHRLAFASFDAEGAHEYSVVVPPGLSGLQLALRSFGVGECGNNEASAPAPVSFL